MHFFKETLSSITPSSLRRGWGNLPEIHFKGAMGGALQDFVRIWSNFIVQVSTLLERLKHTTLTCHKTGSWCVCLRGGGEKRGTREISLPNREILPFSPA